MAEAVMPSVARNTLLSALEEKRRQQMKKYLLHRLFFVAMLREEASEGEITGYHEQLFQKISRFHLGEPASGVLLIYSQSILHILEASSGTLYHILKNLALFEKQGTTLFTQWYATKVEVPVTLEDVTQSQTTEEVITECLTLILKLGVYLATLKVRADPFGSSLPDVTLISAGPAQLIRHILCLHTRIMHLLRLGQGWKTLVQREGLHAFLWPEDLFSFFLCLGDVLR
ncbi:testis-expressed protein 47-like isoform 1-T1 [Liasis olivaceus]